MRCFWIMALVAGTLAIDTAFDDFDVDSYVADQAKMRGFISCVLQEGPCDPFAQFMSDNFAEVVQKACGTCNPKQAQLYKKVTVVVTVQYPGEYDRIRKKFDADNKYTPAFLSFLQGTP